MPRWKLTLQYDGRAFHGWQSQRGVLTVQDALEAALERLCQCAVRSHVAGRTDQGVHALAQVVHVDLPRILEPERMRLAIQAHLKDAAIAVVAAESVSAEFHARFSARMRHYRYRIIQTPYPPVFERKRAWWMPRSLDVAAMQSGAEALLGYHDFSSFRAAGCQAKHALRTLERAAWHQRSYPGGSELMVEFSARSFLYHQVRNMVGTLAEVGQGRRSPADIAAILASCNRTQAGCRPAPPEGLYFVGVDYAD
ncbi:MAG: tRNA pseudouridine(38-40) synthase TruA [Alphaproteobacteria bacterium]|nr:tRNA pseudouridine(38-40) synthase TruA [Alphaproteobacteria bacterium]